jgi:hypothetical protein
MRIASLLLLFGTACAAVSQDRTVCPESRDVRCLSRTFCAMNEARGCQVCRCESASTTGPDGKPALPAGDQR